MKWYTPEELTPQDGADLVVLHEVDENCHAQLYEDVQYWTPLPPYPEEYEITPC